MHLISISSGPTLLFERFYPDKPPRKFFACAVHRDRKGCPFFVWADEKISEEKRERWEKRKRTTMHHHTWYLCFACYRWKGIFHEEQMLINCEEVWGKYSTVRTLPPSRRYHCSRCGVLLLESDLSHHEGHGAGSGVTDEQLLEPTCLVTPKDNKKSQAVRTKCSMIHIMPPEILPFLQQFYFSDSSLQFLCSELKRLNFSHVLCVGTPRFTSHWYGIYFLIILSSCNRLHEAFSRAGDMRSLLLDIDHRYVSSLYSLSLSPFCTHIIYTFKFTLPYSHTPTWPQAQFYPPESFQRYNMFNSFFYSSSGEEICQDFLNHEANSKTAIVIDPPFGGLAEVLAKGIKHLWSMAKEGKNSILS